jgi:hypothetical protein
MYISLPCFSRFGTDTRDATQQTPGMLRCNRWDIHWSKLYAMPVMIRIKGAGCVCVCVCVCVGGVNCNSMVFQCWLWKGSVWIKKAKSLKPDLIHGKKRCNDFTQILMIYISQSFSECIYKRMYRFTIQKL